MNSLENLRCIVTWGNSDHGVILTIGHVVYYYVQWSKLPWASRWIKELARVFYSSTHSVNSFFVLYTKLGASLQGKFG